MRQNPHCAKTTWQGREAHRLANDQVRLLTLTGGGHIAEFRFQAGASRPTLNPLWIPPWKTMEPHRFDRKRDAHRYGRLRDAKLLSGLAGHNLCLDYFGVPSEEEAAQGLSFHGEAPSLRWKKTGLNVARDRITLSLGVRLPVAQLDFRREIELRAGEPVAYFRETVTNLRRADHFFHWTQHVTLGPPFVAPGESYMTAPAMRGKTDPGEYDEGKSLLAPGREFRWPHAPAHSGGKVNLSRMLARKGRGFVATVLLDPRREVEFIAAVNTRHNLAIAYCFFRRDFPWLAVWEENRAIAARPWRRQTEARGLEFGASPLPTDRRYAMTMGPLFGTPTLASVPARSSKTVSYIALLACLPNGFGEVRDIQPGTGEIVIIGAGSKTVRVKASGFRESATDATFLVC